MSRAVESRDRKRADEPSAEAQKAPDPATPPSLSPAGLQTLQRQVGNKAVSDLVARSGGPTLARMPIKAMWLIALDKDQKKTYDSLAGGAKDTDAISDENLEKVVEFFAAEKLTVPEANFRKALDARKPSKTEPVKVPEPEPDPERETEGDRAERERKLLAEGLELLGGENTWAKLKPKIDEWWKKVKDKEDKETFEGAFAADRMTARQINLEGRGGRFQVDTPAGAKGREITLSRGLQGIEQRMDPENFNDPKGESHKNQRGLHDLSASLLDHNKAISKQLKFYKNAIVLFMPAPEEDDLKIFAAIANLDDREEAFLRKVKSEMTRLKLAQSSDMGTTLTDVSKEGGKDKFTYGATGTIIRKKEGKASDASATEIKARRTNALEYTKVLADDVTTVNEVVMAYRSHASELFPMYCKVQDSSDAPPQVDSAGTPPQPGSARGSAPPPPPGGDASTDALLGPGKFFILDADLKPTGEYITDKGKIEKGMPTGATEVQVGDVQKLLATERALWAFHAQVRENAKSPDALRELLLKLTKEQRAQLWTVYDKNQYLGDDAPLDQDTKLSLKSMINELEETRD